MRLNFEGLIMILSGVVFGVAGAGPKDNDLDCGHLFPFRLQITGVYNAIF